MADTSSVGVEPYIEGLKAFAGAIEPGSAKILANVGDMMLPKKRAGN
jgi:hypothetical protein